MLALASVLPLSQSSAGPDYERVLRERLAAPGSTCLPDEDCAAGRRATVIRIAADASQPAEPRPADQVYNLGCAACHDSGVGGAPIKGLAHVWNLRLSADGEQALIDAAWNGKGAMPAKGLCMDCTREEIEAAVLYMIANE